MNIRFTPRALAEAKRIKTWWLKNRPDAPELFEEELRSILAKLSAMPMIGAPYQADVDFPVRRLLLNATEYHVYFGIDDDELVIMSVWGARRRRGPKL